MNKQDAINKAEAILKVLKENSSKATETWITGDVVFEDDFLNVAESIVKNLPTYVAEKHKSGSKTASSILETSNKNRTLKDLSVQELQDLKEKVDTELKLRIN